MNNNLDLAAIRKLYNEATPGPWAISSNTVYSPERVVVDRATYYHADKSEYSREFDAQTYCDIAFIAAAHTTIPALLDEIERLTKENRTLRNELCLNGT